MQKPVNDALAETLDHLSIGILIMLSDASLIHANRTGSEILAEGWPLRLISGRVQAHQRHTTEIIHAGTKQVLGAAYAGSQDVRFDFCMSCTSGRRPAIVGSLKPLARANQDGSKDLFVCMYLSGRTWEEEDGMDCVASTFGLTSRETHILRELEKHDSVKGVATALKLSENTVKTHLQNIFAKTGTSRQTQLLRLMSGLRPALRPTPAVFSAPTPSLRKANAGAKRAASREMELVDA